MEISGTNEPFVLVIHEHWKVLTQREQALIKGLLDRVDEKFLLCTIITVRPEYNPDQIRKVVGTPVIHYIVILENSLWSSGFKTKIYEKAAAEFPESDILWISWRASSTVPKGWKIGLVLMETWAADVIKVRRHPDEFVDYFERRMTKKQTVW